jgi:hypothetical protein
MTAFALSRECLRIPGKFRLGGWALGTSDRGGQDKSRKVRTVGWVRNSAKFRLSPKHCEGLSQLVLFGNPLSAHDFLHPAE